MTLREQREKLGRRLERVAADADCSVQHLRAVEDGKSQPSLDMARRIAAALDLPLDEAFPDVNVEEEGL